MVYSSVTIPLENSVLWAGLALPDRTGTGGLGDFTRQLVSTNTLDELLDNIVRKSVEILHVRFARIVTMENDGVFYFQTAHPSDPLQPACRLKTSVPRAAQAVYRAAALRDTPLVIGRDNSVPHSVRSAMNMSPTDSLYLLPLRVDQEVLGVLAFGEESPMQNSRSSLDDRLRVAAIIADQAAGAIYRARLSHRLKENQEQTVMALARLLESRDPYIGRHSRTVTAVAVRLAVRLGCLPREVETIRYAAMLHDIGKVGIRDDVLHKSGPLNMHEWDVVRRHPEDGATILRVHPNLHLIATLVEAHHERFDGTGYPFGLPGELIPFGSRILAVADAYSAMTDDRPYRPATGLMQAAAELERCSGTQFDPRVVDAFLSIYRTAHFPGA